MLHAATSRHYRAICIAVLVIALVAYAYSIPFRNSDVNGFVLPWYHFILENGRWHAMGVSFSNYTPPYLYVMAIFSHLNEYLEPLTVVKIVSVFGNFLLVASCYYTFTKFYDRRLSLVLATFILILPTVVLNSAIWGQCDAFYTSALILALGVALRNHFFQAMLSFGLALSLKLQAIFLGPALAVFFFRRQIKPWMIPIPIAAYYVMMLPALIAGRSFTSVSLVYFQQFKTFEWLTGSSPNLWAILQKFVYRLHLPEIDYGIGVMIGMVLGIVVSIALVTVGVQGRMDKYRILTTFLVSAISLPYFLPKMFDRYFFAADVLSFVCACCYRSPLFITAAVCVQIGSFLGCLGTPFGYWRGAPYGGVLMGIALALIWFAFLIQAFPQKFGRWDALTKLTLPADARSAI